MKTQYKIQHNLAPIPDAQDMEFKELFVERLKRMTDYDEFRKYSLSFLRRSIRINTLKADINTIKDKLEEFWILEQIPWCKEGFWIFHPDRRDIGNLLEHAAGQIYVQEAASMIPPLILEPKPGDSILDMCAAPGSKTSQIAQYMNNKGALVANDFKGDRLAALGINLQRCGVSNMVITQFKGQRFANTSAKFDKILLDAPCSGSGTIRKSLKTIRIWNVKMIGKIAREQQQLIKAAYECLKPGGTLVYSTCSIEPEENEGVVSWFLDNFPDMSCVKTQLPGLKTSPPVLEWGKDKYNSGVKNFLRIFPQDNDTEGFCVAKLIKDK